MTLTPLAIAALALVNERPMHPYEMYQLLLERREDRMIKVRPGSLYHTVERLHAAKLLEVTGTAREGNRPERTTYAMTDEGREALAARIRELLSHPVREYPHFPVALDEAHNLPPEQAAADLEAYAEALDEEIAEISAVLDAVRERDLAEAYWIGGDYLLSNTIFQRDWIRQLINRIETKELTWQPPKA
jgi:DNA-binding PadR family transcriptional regulator